MIRCKTQWVPPKRGFEVSPTGGRGKHRLAVRGCTPHFLWLRQRKRAVHGPKEKRFRIQILPVGQIWTNTGVSAAGAVRTCNLVPGAPDIGETGAACRRMLRLPACFRGGHRIDQFLFPLPLLLHRGSPQGPMSTPARPARWDRR